MNALEFENSQITSIEKDGRVLRKISEKRKAAIDFYGLFSSRICKLNIYRSIKRDYKIIAKFLYIAQELPYESWTTQIKAYEGEFRKKDHCLKLINEIWMTEKKYVEDLIVVCNLKAKFDSFQKSSKYRK